MYAAVAAPVSRHELGERVEPRSPESARRARVPRTNSSTIDAATNAPNV